jgi:hypothetical protein
VSKASVTKSGYVQKKLKKALDVADEQPGGVAYTIPIRLEECEIPDRLRRWQWVDLFKDNGYERLVRGSRARLTEGENEPPDAKSSDEVIAESDTPRAYSSNEFNDAVTTTIYQTWWDCFNERTQMRVAIQRDGGGADGQMIPDNFSDSRVSFRTFPSPDIRLRSAEAIEILKSHNTPCLIVTRLALDKSPRDAIERSYSPPVQFPHWTGCDDARNSLEWSLRILRESRPVAVVQALGLHGLATQPHAQRLHIRLPVTEPFPVAG